MLATVCRNQEKLLIRPANHVGKMMFTIKSKAGWRILNNLGNITSHAQREGSELQYERQERGMRKIENYA